MDREKLNKAAEEAAEKYINASDAFCNEVFDGFMAGTDWLMQQPLSERLTDAEKEKIRATYKRQGVECFQSIETATTRWVLEKIFGADLFREK